MATVNARKKTGRPRVDSEEVRSRIQQPLLGELDAYASKHDASRAEAIRRLVNLGLEKAKEAEHG